MSITVDWDKTIPRVMHVDYSHRWTWKELYEAEHKGVDLINESSYEHVVVIHQMSRFKTLPEYPVTNIHRLIKGLHPAMRLTIFVGMSGFVKTFWNIAKNYTLRQFQEQHKFDFVSLPDEAILFAIKYLADYPLQSDLNTDPD